MKCWPAVGPRLQSGHANSLLSPQETLSCPILGSGPPLTPPCYRAARRAGVEVTDAVAGTGATRITGILAEGFEETTHQTYQAL